MLFLCCFPHSGNPRAANPEFPFHGFWKAWFPKPEQRWIFRTLKETSTGTPRDTCTRGAVDHQILDVSYNIYKLKHPFGCFCFWKAWFPKPEQRRIFNISQDCILEKREKIIAKQYLFFRATHLMSLRGVANGDAVAISRKGILEKRYGGGILYCI